MIILITPARNILSKYSSLTIDASLPIDFDSIKSRSMSWNVFPNFNLFFKIRKILIVLNQAKSVVFSVCFFFRLFSGNSISIIQYIISYEVKKSSNCFSQSAIVVIICRSVRSFVKSKTAVDRRFKAETSLSDK